jgi:hypothetical protein
MEIVEVDLVGAQAGQAGVACGANALGTSIDANHVLSIGSGALDPPGLGRQDELLAPAADSAAEQQLVVPISVRVRRVEKGYSQVERAMKRGD